MRLENIKLKEDIKVTSLKLEELEKLTITAMTERAEASAAVENAKDQHDPVCIQFLYNQYSNINVYFFVLVM